MGWRGLACEGVQGRARARLEELGARRQEGRGGDVCRGRDRAESHHGPPQPSERRGGRVPTRDLGTIKLAEHLGALLLRSLQLGTISFESLEELAHRHLALGGTVQRLGEKRFRGGGRAVGTAAGRIDECAGRLRGVGGWKEKQVEGKGEGGGEGQVVKYGKRWLEGR